MNDALRNAYLRRLGVAAGPPTVEGLFDLHRAQTERVAYETLWIHLGERWGIDLAGSVDREATKGRGGYCFHLNGAFGALLSSLGYHLTQHVGGVHGADGASENEMTNHLVLTVDGLPTTENPGGVWYVDVGLGDAMHEPLPLVEGTYRQGPFTLSLERTPRGVGDWHLTHDLAGGFKGMAWRSAAAEIDDFATKHQWLSTSPESGFVRVLTAQRRDATGVDILRGLVLRRIGAEASEQTLTSSRDLFDLMGSLFGLDVSGVERTARQGLWAKTSAAHEAWVGAGKP
ncbi:MAG: N-hydroxyarylamine O-acetyltransferase [Actinomycetota bacterium]|nr:N-hydroxyarylamine O-acetyltransferase [Actinomycetota bacterium]